MVMRWVNIPRNFLRGALCIGLAVSFNAIALESALPSFGLGGEAWAQDAPSRKPKTRRVKSLSKSAAKILIEANEYMDEERWQDALQSINRLLQNRSKFNDYEIATAYQMQGGVYAALERYGDATRSFQRAIGLNALSDGTQQSLTFNLAQLYLMQEQPRKTIKLMKEWFRTAEKPGGGAYYLLGLSYYMLEQFSNALPYAENAIYKNPEESKRQGWYQVLLGIYLERKSYTKAENMLEILIAKWPGQKNYYIQLAAVATELKKDRKSFAVQKTAYEMGFLTTSSELVRLAQLYSYYEAPYFGAKLLDKGLRAGQVKKTKSNWELLANSWVNAREWDKAIAPLGNAAKLSKDGLLYLRLAQTHMEDQNWAKTISAVKNAFKKGKLKDPGQAWTLKGIAHTNREEFKSALAAFGNASKYAKHRTRSNQWINHINNLIEVRESEKDEGI